MSTFEKAMTVLISVGLFTLGFVALCLAALFLSGCAKAPVIPVVPVAVTRVVLEASVPGHALFCVEDPYSVWPNDEPIIRREFGEVCGVTVDDVRRWVSRMRAAD